MCAKITNPSPTAIRDQKPWLLWGYQTDRFESQPIFFQQKWGFLVTMSISQRTNTESLCPMPDTSRTRDIYLK